MSIIKEKIGNLRIFGYFICVREFTEPKNDFFDTEDFPRLCVCVRECALCSGSYEQDNIAYSRIALYVYSYDSRTVVEACKNRSCIICVCI